MAIGNAFSKNSLRELKISFLCTISLYEIVKTNLNKVKISQTLQKLKL